MIQLDFEKAEDAKSLLSLGNKYIKKPIPVRAVQIAIPFTVKTLEGTMKGKPNDYLVEGIEGELYVCDKTIFEKSYDKVNDSDKDMKKKEMKTATELKEQYEKDMKELQENCKHKDISDWIIIYEFHGNDTGVKVKQCNICWKELEYKAPCEACHKEFTYVKRDWSTSQLCPTCLKKGKYYCYKHKKLHSNRHGCPKCLKMFKEAEKI